MPRKVKSRFQVLNDFQSSKSLALGKDYSFDYAGSRNMMLYILDENEKLGRTETSSVSLVSFKCFLESFSIKFGVVFAEEETNEGSAKEPEDFSCDYEITLNVPAASVNDSRVNLARLEEVVRMCLSGMFVLQDEEDDFGALEGGVGEKRVLLANLIHNGHYKKFHEIASQQTVRKYGMRCYFANASFDVDMESGFFEYKNKLFPKAYKLTLNLDLSFDVDTQISDNRYLCGFGEDGAYDDQDVKTWPFGVL